MSTYEYTADQIEACYPEAYDFTLDFEGGYVNHPDDPGGCTNMGITIHTFRDWRNDQSLTCDDLENMDDDEAAQIYAENYWTPVWGDKLPVGVNTMVWDFGVNAGTSRSIQHLQRIVGSPDDGIMGPNTLEAVKQYISLKGMDKLLAALHDDRQTYYESLSTFDTFGDGWTRRNGECLALAKDLAADADDWDDTDDDDLEDRVAAIEDWIRSFPL